MAVTKDGRYHTVWRDHLNSTDTPLAAGAIWTGTATEDNHSHVNVSGISDTEGTLQFMFSINDGETFDSVINFEVEKGVPFYRTLVKGNRHYKTRFINRGGDQKTFRLQTEFGTFSAPIGIKTGGQLVEIAGPLTQVPTGGTVFSVSDLETQFVHDALHEVIDQLKVVVLHLNEMTGANWKRDDV